MILLVGKISNQVQSVAQASRDLGVHGTVLRSWVKVYEADLQHSYPGHEQMKPEQLEIARLKREVTKLKAERDILKKGITPVDANRPFRMMYWASWDGTPAYTHGFNPRQVSVRKVDDNRFEMTFDRIHQPWQEGDTGTIVFSNDGKRVTETRSGFTVDGKEFHNDIRVYDKIVPADWPGEIRAR